MNLLNMIQWGELNEKETLFKNVSFPKEIDKDIAIDTIVFDNWDLSLYTTDYNLLKLQIENFFKLKFSIYEKIVEALELEYNPLHNYDRYEDKNEDTTHSIKNTDSNSNNSTSVDETSAFNSTTYQPKDKNTYTYNANDTRNEEGNNKYVTSNHLYGNIGVTTSQQMLESEMELRQKYNIYEIISNDFRDKFCLSIFE